MSCVPRSFADDDSHGERPEGIVWPRNIGGIGGYDQARNLRMRRQMTNAGQQINLSVPRSRTQTELVGKAVILTNGMAGTVDRLWLDELHGLRISIGSHDGNWPVATIKFAEM